LELALLEERQFRFLSGALMILLTCESNLKEGKLKYLSGFCVICANVGEEVETYHRSIEKGRSEDP
jgi:hypothetical protein